MTITKKYFHDDGNFGVFLMTVIFHGVTGFAISFVKRNQINFNFINYRVITFVEDSSVQLQMLLITTYENIEILFGSITQVSQCKHIKFSELIFFVEKCRLTRCSALVANGKVTSTMYKASSPLLRPKAGFPRNASFHNVTAKAMNDCYWSVVGRWNRTL